MRIIPIILHVIAFAIGNSVALQAQIFTAKNGSFVVFQDAPDKIASVTISGAGQDHKKYQWPSNENEFIQEYRLAEKVFTGPAMLTDEDLQKVWLSMKEMTVFAPYYRFNPTMLLALGQAAFIPGDEKLTSCTISIRHDKETQTKTLQWQDPMMGGVGQAESIKDNGLDIQLKFLFPKESWMKGAKLFKKPVGAQTDMEIFPLIYTTNWSDRVEMNIRDTMNQVGEFLYTLQAIDYLGNTHPALQPVYAHNYNKVSQPVIHHFNIEAVKESKSIRLAWNCTVLERVKGFEIYRGMESNGPFMRIASLTETDSVYIDHVEGVMQNFFYYVQILDQMGPGAKSIIRFVTPLVKEKPEPPIDLVAVPSREGVLLTWPAMDGLYHTRGYYVYRRAQDTTSWTQVSEFIPRSAEIITYTDTSRILQTENEYTYVVRSESTSYQLSDPSVMAISRPGKPRDVVTPQDLSWRYMDDGHLMLHWNDQRKFDPYILLYHIYTANAEGLPDKEVAGSPMEVNQNFWIQTEMTPSKYGYCISAEDAWENKSVCSTAVNPFSSNKSLNPGPILVHPITTGYKLSWGLPAASSVQSILLYEINDKEEAVLVKSLTPQTNSYDIPKLKTDQVRSFYISYKTLDGKESDAGDVVVVNK